MSRWDRYVLRPRVRAETSGSKTVPHIGPYSTAYHPLTDGQTERVIQILEDMLRACVLAHDSKWEDCLPYAEFSYNNSYQASLKMSPFEALYGRKCRTPLDWSQTGDSCIFGTDLMLEA